MHRLAKVWLFVVACLFSLTAHSQVSVISGQTISTSGAPLPYTQIRICSATSTGVPCNPTVPIYSDFGLTHQIPNPTSADEFGNYTVYGGTLPAPNLYTVQYSPGSDSSGNPIVWAYVVNGPFLSSSGGTVTGFINALGYNGVPEADQCSGVDANAKINTCAALIPNGGFEDARGFGATTQTSTTALTALSLPTRPITLELNPATKYIENVVFSGGSIAAKTACIIPIAQGSAIETPGWNQVLNVQLGPSAATYDLVCNATQDGTQESFRIDGLGLQGNASATMAGSLLHVKNTYAGTQIKDVWTYQPFGTALTDEGGSDHFYVDDNFSDASTAGGYAGSVVNLICPNATTFQNGAIQFNGVNNPLVTIQGYASGGPTSCPLGTSAYGVHFYNVDLENTPATVGSFSGAPTNVDPIQCTDCVDVTWDKLILWGNKGTGQNHVVDILSSGLNGQGRGPVEIKDIQVLPTWSAVSLIHNATGVYVSPTQADVFGQENGSGAYQIGEYRWTGNGVAQGSSTDYIDSEIVSSMQSLNTNSAINAALEPGATIDQQVAVAVTHCAANGCEVDIPAGDYPYTNSITLPLNFLSAFRLVVMPGAFLNYSGTGCAINTAVVSSPTESSLDVGGGGTIGGSASGQGGVCVLPTNSFHVHDLKIFGFTNGYGVWVEGANAGTIDHNLIINSAAGVYATPTYCSGATCGISPVANPYTANAINIENNTLTADGWGAEYFDLVSSDLSAALLINVTGNDLENNSTGGLLIGRSRAATVQANYFEGDGVGIRLGVSAGASFWETAGAHVVGNFFTVTTSMPIDIDLQNTVDTTIEANSQNYGGSEGPTNCMINGLTYTAAVSGGELNTFVGINHKELASVGNYMCETVLFTASISGTTMTVTGTPAGVIQIGQTVSGTGVAAGTTITAGSGTSWTVSISQTVGSEAMSAVSGVPQLTGTGSFFLMNSNYQYYIADQAFQVNQGVTSEVINLELITSTGGCDLRPAAGNTTAINNGRTTILAGTSYLSAITNGSVTMVHPSGEAITVDIACYSNATGGYQ